LKDYAATFRDRDDCIVGLTDASTICWAPRRPSRFAAVSEDGTEGTILRCGDCAGCRELDRRRLVSRLCAHYEKTKEVSVIVFRESHLSRVKNMVRRLGRIARCGVRRRWIRSGPGGVALIVDKARSELPATIGSNDAISEIIRVFPANRPYAWRYATRGMLIPRSDYGEQVNRFYHRGLPKAERRDWHVDTRRGIGKLSGLHRQGIRAFRGEIGLYPPEAWHVPRLVRRDGPNGPVFAGGLTSIGDIIRHSVAMSSSASTPSRRSLSSDQNRKPPRRDGGIFKPIPLDQGWGDGPISKLIRALASSKSLPSSQSTGSTAPIQGSKNRRAVGASSYQNTETPLRGRGYKSSGPSNQEWGDGPISKLISEILKRKDSS
jgi:hypothetical protein